MNRTGVAIGVAGGLGLGLLLGSEFSGRIVTIAGAAIMTVSIILMIVLSAGKGK